jgi:hypothetical protein
MPPCLNQQVANTNSAHDGSALMGTTGSTTQFGDTNGQDGTPTVLYPNGNQFYSDGILEDRNGNKVSITNGTDSLAKTAFATTIPLQGQTISPGSYTISTRNANNGTETYNVVFTKETLGTFSMP